MLDRQLYNRWLRYYLKKGLKIAAADELAYLKVWNHLNKDKHNARS